MIPVARPGGFAGEFHLRTPAPPEVDPVLWAALGERTASPTETARSTVEIVSRVLPRSS